MASEITQQTFDRFSFDMCRRFFARMIRKELAVEMQAVAAIFDVLRVAGVGVPVGGDFLTHYGTSLGPFVYMPGAWPLAVQFEVLVHELQHVNQFWGRDGQTGLGGGVHFGWLYAVEPEARVAYEAEAYRAGFELAWALRREVPDVDRVVESLRRGYALDDAACTLARDLLEVAATSVVQGHVSTASATAAIAWIKSNAPEMLHGAST